MAIALVTSTHAAFGNNGGSTAGINTTGANLLVVGIERYNGTATLSDSKSNAFTPLTSYGTSSDTLSRFYYCASPTVGSSHTFTVSGNTLYGVIQVLAVSGADVSPFDVENGAGTSTGTSVQPGSVTPAQDGSLIATIVCFGGSFSNLAIDSSFSIDSQDAYSAGNNDGGAIAYLIQGSAAAVNPTWSWTGSISRSSAIAVFKPAATGQPSARRFALCGEEFNKHRSDQGVIICEHKPIYVPQHRLLIPTKC